MIVVAGACGDDDASDATRTTTPTEAPTATETTTTRATNTATDADASSLAQSCTNPEAGYSLRYPEGWFTSTGDVVPPCRLFDVEEIDVEPATEPDVPVTADVEPAAFDRIAEPDRNEEVVSRRETEIAGRRAIRLETSATEDAPLRQAGALVTRWIVDLGREQTVVATARANAPVEYEEARDVLDAMIETLQLEAAAGA